MKFGEQGLVAGQKPCIEQRRANGRIVAALYQTVFDGACGMTDL